MSEALTKPLPCPFCGADDGLTMTDGSTYRWGYAYCSNCGASAGETRRAYPDDGKWHEEAIRQWNQRAAPTPRKPLTDDEIAQAMFRAHAIVTGPTQFRFAREIERAHGIGEQHGS